MMASCHQACAPALRQRSAAQNAAHALALLNVAGGSSSCSASEVTTVGSSASTLAGAFISSAIARSSARVQCVTRICPPPGGLPPRGRKAVRLPGSGRHGPTSTQLRDARGSTLASMPHHGAGDARRCGDADPAVGPSLAGAICAPRRAMKMRHAFSSAATAAAASSLLQAGPARRSASAAVAALSLRSQVKPNSVTCSHRAAAMRSAKNAAGGARPPAHAAASDARGTHAMCKTTHRVGQARAGAGLHPPRLRC